MNSEIKMAKATVRRIDDKIIEIDYLSENEFELEDAIKANNAYFELSNGQPFVSLIDVRGKFGNISHEARQHYVTNEKTKNIRLAEAIVIDQLGHRIVANFYLKINKPNNPVKIFKQRDEAIKWLHQVYDDFFIKK